MNKCSSPIELGFGFLGFTVMQAQRGKGNVAAASPGITRGNGGLGLCGNVQQQFDPGDAG